MPTYFTHLAVAKRYAEKNNLTGNDAKEFFLGNVAVDLYSDGSEIHKRARHYYKPEPHTRTVENLFKNRVDFDKYFANNKVQTQFERGYLMHLIVDNFCYHEVLDLQRFISENKKGIRGRGIIVKSFDSVDAHLQKRYNLDYNMAGVKREILECLDKWAKRNAAQGIHSELNLFDTKAAVKKLDDFIEKISSVDLDAFIASYSKT